MKLGYEIQFECICLQAFSFVMRFCLQLIKLENTSIYNERFTHAIHIQKKREHFRSFDINSDFNIHHFYQWRCERILPPQKIYSNLSGKLTKSFCFCFTHLQVFVNHKLCKTWQLIRIKMSVNGAKAFSEIKISNTQAGIRLWNQSNMVLQFEY